MNILVTGGAGYIGSHTVVELGRRSEGASRLGSQVHRGRYVQKQLEFCKR